MATVVADAPVIEKPSRRTGEHRFFWGMSILIALVVFIGFSRTYFLAPFFHVTHVAAAPHGLLVHVHAAVFTSWIALLVTQASLAASGNINIHRRLGLAGLALAPAMVILGVLVATEMVRRLGHVPHFDAPAVYAVALSEITGFALPVFFAFRMRRRSAYHKRLILIGTIAMMTAAFGRFPVRVLLHQPLPAMICTFSLLALVAAYDLLSIRRTHPATAWAGAWVVSIELMGDAVGHTAAWHGFTAGVLRLVA
jgi:hypothetical protein